MIRHHLLRSKNTFMPRSTPFSGLLFHMGMNKTGSTFLQHAVFPQLLGISGYKKDSISAIQTEVALRQKKRSEQRILSREGLAGKAEARDPGSTWSDFERTLELIRPIKSQVSVLVFFRPQFEYVTSCYWHLVKKNLFKGSFEGYLEHFNERDLSWADRVTYLKEFRSLIFFHSELRQDPEQVIAVIRAELGLPGDFQIERREAVNLSASTKAQLRAAQWMSKALFTPVLHKFRQISGLGRVFQSSENMQHVVLDSCIRAH